MSMTYRNPSNLKRKRDHGFRKRMSTKNGRKILARRRKKGRVRLTVSDEQNSKEDFPFFLKKKHEYDGVKATGSVVRNPFFTLIYTQVSDKESPRVGIIVGRRAGNAVTRNRLKRIFRELVRASYSDMAHGHHCIVYPKIKILESKFQDVYKAWKSTLGKAGIVQSNIP